jgi:hypothetical protein
MEVGDAHWFDFSGVKEENGQQQMQNATADPSLRSRMTIQKGVPG